MSGSSFGKIFTVTTWGESHGEGLGVVIDGCPAGLELSVDDIQEALNRRKPGTSQYTTPRKEDDELKILSGIFQGKTTGTPISLMVMNTNQISKDYSNIKDIYRPGHADLTYDARYGFRDYRGGGRSSGRETIGRVAAGAVAKKILKDFGVSFLTYTRSIGPIEVKEPIDTSAIYENPLYMPDNEAYERAASYLNELKAMGNSSGGIIECVITNYPAGCGNPVFEKLDAMLAKAITSIGAVKGFEIGSGFQAAKMTGVDHNDTVEMGPFGNLVKHTNHAGGILGGISDGSPIILRAAIKPTPSISLEQKTITKEGQTTSISIQGRHDPIIVPRAVVVVESMVALTLVDALLQQPTANMENLRKFFE
ncbi:chorismate synthase [Vallitalea okinawensis]|uniref:chorismate synthase n=1 Tax=Vallitalea okinawensis TaxID=2078660 RepID=UPI000CFDE2B7|nr:chorismate synthase [Vallitalea okinawensis]